jgi:hypothetical protein
MPKNSGFTQTGEIQFNWATSDAYTASARPPDRYPTTPKNLPLRCNDCQTEWVALESATPYQPGTFNDIPGAYLVACPNRDCGQQGSFSIVKPI